MRLDREKIRALTGFKRKKNQAEWFIKFLGVDVPCDRLGPILTDAAYEKLLEKRLGVIPESTHANYGNRPTVKLLKSST